MHCPNSAGKGAPKDITPNTIEATTVVINITFSFLIFNPPKKDSYSFSTQMHFIQKRYQIGGGLRAKRLRGL
jgi:hypothetical protein